MRLVWLYILTVLLASVAFALMEYFFETSWVATLFSISPALIAFTYSAFDSNRPFKSLGWRPAFRYWGVITLSIGIVVALLLLIAWFLGHMQINEKSVSKFLRVSTFTSLIVGILINTGEEAGWRGYLFPSLTREKGWWKAVFLTSFIWWLWHVPFMTVLQIRMFGHVQVSTQLIHFLGLIPATILLGIWMKDSGSFWAIGFAHQLTNFINKWFLGLEHSEKLPLFFTDKSYVRIYSTENGILGSFAITGLALAYYLYARKKKPELLSN